MLTKREKECIQLASEGLSAKEVGERLSISQKTVEAHLRAARGKVDARNTAHLVYISYKTGAISGFLIACALSSVFSGDDVLRPNRVRTRISRTTTSSSVKREWVIYS